MVRALPRKPLHYVSRACLMHIDIDCFFVAVAIRNKPELIGHPVAICHGSGAGTSASRGHVNIPAEEHLYEKYRKVGAGQRVEAGESFSELASCSYSARAKGVRSGMYLGQAQGFVCVFLARRFLAGFFHANGFYTFFFSRRFFISV